MTVLCKSRTSEASSVCPKCNTIAVHFLRRPRVCLVHPHRGEGKTVEIHKWGQAEPIRRITFPPGGWYDEQKFDCIRECRACACEWGQT